MPLLVPPPGRDSMAARGSLGAREPISETTVLTSSAGQPPTEADVRRWLALLERPDRLVDSDLVTLLVDRGLLPPDLTGLDAARAATHALVELIEGIRPPDG